VNRPHRSPTPSDALFIGAILLAGIAGCVLWTGATVACALTGNQLPGSQLTPILNALLAHPDHPAAAWGHPVGPVAVYWGSTILIAVVAATGLLVGSRHLSNRPTTSAQPGHRWAGLATRSEVARASGKRSLQRQAATLRPSLPHPTASELGHRLGHSRGVTCYSSVEDSMMLIGPPRSGKGLHIVINTILDAPGAVLTTSTRPDNLTVTLTARAKIGPVAVFDPQGLAPRLPSATRWSPIRGCQHPQTALIRANALTVGVSAGTTDSTYWQSSAEQAVRCLLHAAALADKTSRDLYRWSLSTAQAREAVTILATHAHAAPSWHQALDAILGADPRQRDSIWSMVGLAFACLADPNVLHAVSPGPRESFDPDEFLRHRGAVFLVGTSTGAAATAGLVGAFVEDVAEAARRLAARSSGGRLDPPLAMILDEAANYPLPSLSSLMSEGGGTGISTLVVVQSLAQARAVWGEHQAGAIWDAAIVKLILGGGSNARDLDDLSKLTGQREDRQHSNNISGDGYRSWTTSTRDIPVMDTSRLRTLPFGTGMLLLRTAKPILLTLTPWTARPNRADLQGDKNRLEAIIRDAHTQTPQP
jgi:type IV secretion system protein VirD4